MWKPKEMDPFWAVCLASRYSKATVNMEVHHCAYKFADPKLPYKNNNVAGFNMGMLVELPVLTNPKALKKGDILALPFCVGPSDILLKEDIPKHTESWTKHPT